VRLDIRRIGPVKDGAEIVGSRTRVKVAKNKCAAPYKQAEFDIMFGKGVSKEGSLIDIGVELGLVRKSGAWFAYDEELLGQGRENAKVFLAEHADVAARLTDALREAMPTRRIDGIDELAAADTLAPDEAGELAPSGAGVDSGG
jgi:recombination protein RecA